jgi:Tfp pilus assembly PilM family ATPase
MNDAAVKPSANPSKARRLQFRTRSASGVDVGARSVKAVQFATDRVGDGSWRVAAVAEMPREATPETPAAGQPAAPQSQSQGATAAKVPPLTVAEVRRLVATLERQGFEGSNVVLAVPNDRVYSSMLELPPRSSNAPLEQIARLEMARSHRLAPDAFEMGSWDLPAAARATRQTHVMAVACTHADAAALMDPFEAEGLTVTALDVKAAALARACAPLLDADAGGITGLVDLGWTSATLSLMHQGVVIYGRTLGDSGLHKLYATLAGRLGLDGEVIDYLLSDTGLSAGRDPAAKDAPPVTPAAARKTKNATDAAGLIAAHFEAAVHELQVSLSYAQHQYPDTPLSRLLVVGGGACIRGVTEHLRRTLGIEALAVAPADVATCPKHLVGPCASPAMTAALGLAQFDLAP